MSIAGNCPMSPDDVRHQDSNLIWRTENFVPRCSCLDSELLLTWNTDYRTKAGDFDEGIEQRHCDTWDFDDFPGPLPCVEVEADCVPFSADNSEDFHASSGNCKANVTERGLQEI